MTMTYKAWKNVLTQAMAESLRDSGYGDMMARNWVEYVSVEPDRPDQLPPMGELESLVSGESGRFEVYLTGSFFLMEFSDKMAEQRNHTYTAVEPTPEDVEDWLNDNLQGVDITVDRLVPEGNELTFYFDSKDRAVFVDEGDLDEYSLEPDEFDELEDLLDLQSSNAVLNREEQERLQFLLDKQDSLSSADIPPENATPATIQDYTVVGTVVIAKKALRRALRAYKAYRAGNLAAMKNIQTGINPYKRAYRNNRELESIYEALQELQVQAGNANLHSALSKELAETSASELMGSNLRMELVSFIDDLNAIALGDIVVDPYEFGAVIADILFEYEDALLRIP